MKNHNLISASVFFTLFLFVMPARANHLDGLWRNHRNNITLRIESQGESFRAKRTDQGNWYKYLTKDGYQYTDLYGNSYIIQSDNEIVWKEANSGRKIYFSKIENRRDESWEHWDNPNAQDFAYHGYKYDTWRTPWNYNHADLLNGRWIDSYRNNELEIECFRDGIRVRSECSGWEKYYPDRYEQSYKDKFGNTIRLIDLDSIRWESEHGRHDRIYNRAS
jgi:hypothetical protein